MSDLIYLFLLQNLICETRDSALAGGSRQERSPRQPVLGFYFGPDS